LQALMARKKPVRKKECGLKNTQDPGPKKRGQASGPGR